MRLARFTAGMALLGAVAAGQGLPPGVEGAPPKLLSEYRLFKDLSKHIPEKGVIPYDLNTPLFSDYTHKRRFVYVPRGAQARFQEREPFDFPVGTILVKTFSQFQDIRDPAKGERLIETRLLIHKPDGWIGLPYVWNKEQTDAVLKIAGKAVDISWIHYDGAERTINYIVPNVNQCKACHRDDSSIETLRPLGPKARHLNKDFVYEGGAANQLAHWKQAGILEGVPAVAERLPVWNDPATGTLEERARAWLEINCAHCHNPKGPASNSALDLAYHQRDPAKWGMFKTPVAAGRGSGRLAYDIVPGKPEESILVYRLESLEPGVMMPELPRRTVDEEGVKLIREWIASMR